MIEGKQKQLGERMNDELPSRIETKASDNASNSISNIYRHYLCPLCHIFPKIILKENKNVCVYCKEIKGLEIALSDYIKYYLSEGDIREYAQSDPNNKYIGYCFGCKINFSDNHSNEHKTHNIINFNAIGEEKLNFIKKKLNIPDIIEEDPKSGTHLSSLQKNSISNTLLLESTKDNKLRKVEKKNEIDNLYKNEEFLDLIHIIINDLKLYPNYTHYENIKNIFYYLSDQMEIEYHNYEKGNLDIRIFGESFVKNNVNNFILFIDGKEEKLKEIIKVKGPKETLKIKLIKIKETTDLSDMFCKCDCLSKINIKNGWNTSNVTTMSGMFSGCKALEFLPDMSKWEINKVTDLSSMFEGCETIESLPDISKWNVENVKSMRDMFNGCESLEYLPDLSEWKTNNLENIDSIFQNCMDLISLKGLENWKTSQITNMSYVFKNCYSLTELGDISNWNTKNVKSFSNMFADCKSITKLPDLSKWKTQNAKKMNFMFSNCTKLESLPDISKWNVQNVISMNNMFENCSSLQLFPDISKWRKNKDLDTSYMFIGCDSLKEIPSFNNI